MQLAVCEQVKLTVGRRALRRVHDKTYDDIVKVTIIEKSQFLYNILNIEENYFAKRENFDVQREKILIEGIEKPRRFYFNVQTERWLKTNR